jgi:hypothetical protein
VAIYVNPRPLPGRRKREIMVLGRPEAVEPPAPLPPPPSPIPEFDGLDPLLLHFLSLDRQALLTIPGMTPDRVQQVIEARQGCRVWADLEARLKHDPDLMNAIYFNMATRFAGELARGRNGTLFVASDAKDAPPLDLRGEYGWVRERLKDVAVVRDPTVGLLSAIVGTGRFQQVWISGHGEPGEVIFTGQDGNMVRVSAQEIAQAVSNSPSVKSVIGSVCFGAFGGEKSVVDTIAAHGPTAVGYEAPVLDSDAIRMSAIIAEKVAANVPVAKAVEEARASVFAGRFGDGSTTERDLIPDPTPAGTSHNKAVDDQLAWVMRDKGNRVDELQAEYPWMREDDLAKLEADPGLLASRMAEEFDKGKPFAQVSTGSRQGG